MMTRRAAAAPRSGTARVLAVSCTALLAGCGSHDATTHVATAPATGDAAYAVSVEQAEGAHAVALSRCEALAAQARDACIARADTDLERARAAARRTRDEPTPR